MTEHNQAPSALLELLTGRVDELAHAVLARLVAELPEYRLLPAEELTGDILRVTEANLRLFLTVLAEDRALSADELDEVRRSAALRAEEGVPLEAVLAAYHLGAAVCWDSAAAELPPERAGDLVAAYRPVLDYLRAITPVVAGSYVEYSRLALGEEHGARQSVLAALLAGAHAGDEVTGLVQLPARFAVLAVHVGAHPDESRPEVDAQVVVRRKLRRLRAEAEHHAREPVLASLSATGGVLLLPDRDAAGLAKLVARMGKAAGAEVTVALDFATPDEVATVAERTREVLAVVRALGREPGCYRLADVLLEYQLTRPGPARDALAALLDPLGAHPDLLDTVRTYFEQGRNRRRTANLLHVHPNTVDYRLLRVARLTGLNAADAGQAQRLGAALVARRFSER